MSSMNLSEAARVWGVARATIYRHRNNGTLSVNKSGRKVTVDAAEMQRVFGNPKKVAGEDVSRETGNDTSHGTTGDSASVQATIAVLEERNASLQAQLERALDTEQRLLGIVEKQQMLLTDQREQPAGFLARIFKR